MKKILFRFIVICQIVLIIQLIFLSVVFAEEKTVDSNENSILIKTIDNTEAIEIFKNALPKYSYMLSKNGFSDDSIIGTPFSMEYQGDNKVYLFYFPIINNGTIVSYVEQTVSEDGSVSWAISKWFDAETDLEQFRGDTAYALIRDKNFNLIAFTDEKVIPLTIWSDVDIDYDTPYMYVKTTVVDITKPIDIDTSEIILQSEEEANLLEDAESNGKTIVTLNLSDDEVLNRNNHVLVPVRDLAELMGCEVSWDGNTKTAYIKKDDTIVSFVINETSYLVNDDAYFLDVPAEISNSKTYIPLRAASEALGAEIAYNENSKTITLSYKK